MVLLVLAPEFGDAGAGATVPLPAKALILCGSVKKCRCNINKETILVLAKH